MHTKTRFRFVVSAALLFVAVLLAVTGSGAGQALAAPAAGVLPPSTACTGTGSGTVTCNLWAKTGTLTLPGSVTVPVWGYADSAGGSVQVPGPVLEAVTGDTVTVNLTNNLGPGRSTSLAFEGQAMMPDTTGVGDGLTKSYTFTATAPGTFLYEAGPLANAQHQVPMGLYGALIVRPAGLPGQAYTKPETAFNDEALVVLSEIDPALNNSRESGDLRPAQLQAEVLADQRQGLPADHGHRHGGRQRGVAALRERRPAAPHDDAVGRVSEGAR